MGDFFVHPSAYVDSCVRIGRGTRVWHYCHIMPGATIGQDCNLGQNTFVGRDVSIGSRCKVQNNVSIYEGVTLEDGVFCGPSCVFTNDLTPRAEFPKNGKYVRTLVRHGASIGANATIVCGITIGRYAMIGAGSVVTRDVPDFALVYGAPARARGWACKCGTRLMFVDQQTQCVRCGRRFAQDGATVREAEEMAEDLSPTRAGWKEQADDGSPGGSP